MIDKRIYVYVTEKHTVKIDVVQGTVGNPIRFVVADEEIPENAEARVYIKKPSGLTVYQPAEVTENNSVTLTPVTQTFVEPGLHKMNIQLVAGSVIIYSFVVTVDVQKNEAFSPSEESESYDYFLKGAKGDRGEKGAKGDPGNPAMLLPVDTATGNPITIKTGAALPAEGFTVRVDAEQGEGAPSPTNIVPITGFNSINVGIAPSASEAPSETEIALPETIYGGTVDLVAGTITIDRAAATLAASNLSPVQTSVTGTGKFITWAVGVDYVGGSSVICDRMQPTDFAHRGQAYQIYAGKNKSSYLQFFVPAEITTKEEVVAAVGGAVAVVYLDSPRTVHLTAQDIELLAGSNYITGDAGEMTVTFRSDIAEYINRRIQQ